MDFAHSISKRLKILVCISSLPRLWGETTGLVGFWKHRGGESAAAITTLSTNDMMPSSVTSEGSEGDLAIIFSDLDGTLIHYSDSTTELLSDNEIMHLVQLPESSTGMVGIISAETLRLCQEFRRNDVKLVLVSGMRTSTLLKRLPYLPKADAYCAEAGGRIFFAGKENCQGINFRVDPKPYYGALQGDLEPFFIAEDMEWRRKMERSDAAGVDGFLGSELNSTESETPVPISERSGALWRHARSLEDRGFILDLKGYSTCFRVNRKHQRTSVNFDALLEGKIACPKGLGTSTNLGCVDFYPEGSGKKNCCAYIASKLGSECGRPILLDRHCVCLCDDDNDVAMAMACLHAYIPNMTSASMAAIVRENPQKFTLTTREDEIDPTKATNRALTMVLERILFSR